MPMIPPSKLSELVLTRRKLFEKIMQNVATRKIQNSIQATGDRMSVTPQQFGMQVGQQVKKAGLHAAGKPIVGGVDTNGYSKLEQLFRGNLDVIGLGPARKLIERTMRTPGKPIVGGIQPPMKLPQKQASVLSVLGGLAGGGLGGLAGGAGGGILGALGGGALGGGPGAGLGLLAGGAAGLGAGAHMGGNIGASIGAGFSKKKEKPESEDKSEEKSEEKSEDSGDEEVKESAARVLAQLQKNAK